MPLFPAIEAALRAGSAILEVYRRDFAVEYKADCSPLTAADTAAHETIVERLQPLGLPILSEESEDVLVVERAAWRRFWLVDPLDGTKEFVKKNGEFTVNVALVAGGRPWLGVVYAPVLDILYWGSGAAGPGEGAWKATGCAGRTAAQVLDAAVPLSVAAPGRPGESLRIVASRSHCGERTVAFIEQLEARFGAGERVSLGSSLKLCLVAEGSAHVYPRIAPTMEWDTAAAQAVVEAAGGNVYEYDPALTAIDYLDPAAAPGRLRSLRYNKDDLRNPFFVACGSLDRSGGSGSRGT